MLFLILISVIVSIIYNLLLLDYSRIWNQESSILIPALSEDKLPFLSVVIVSRNEPQLKQCILSIIEGSYPIDKYEIILVDDHSEMGSLNEIINLNVSNLEIIHLHDYNTHADINGYKKYGQELAIQNAQYDWIISTDGDCVVPINWMRTMSSYTTNYKLVTGPIRMTGPSNWLTKLQQFDVIGTMIGTNYGISTKRWYSANAANMLFRKEVHMAYVEQIEKENYASGDDIFLIQFAAQNSIPLTFAHSDSAIVETPAECSWSGFYNQRLRWASKSNAYDDWGMRALVYAIGFYNLFVALMLLYGCISWNGQVIVIGLLTYLAKCVAEFLLFKRADEFFKLSLSFWQGLVLSGMHMLYILIIGFASLFVSDYKWKGRKVR